MQTDSVSNHNHQKLPSNLVKYNSMFINQMKQKLLGSLKITENKFYQVKNI
jgi:hypothetical protein